jgi:hypothetical protein
VVLIGQLCNKANVVVLVAPIPRYLAKKCRDDPGHTDNYNREDFKSEISAGIGIHKRLLESWAHELNMNSRIVDATELVDPAEPILWNVKICLPVLRYRHVYLFGKTIFSIRYLVLGRYKIEFYIPTKYL